MIYLSHVFPDHNNADDDDGLVLPSSCTSSPHTTYDIKGNLHLSTYIYTSSTLNW